MFRTLIYSEPWHILKLWYIQKPIKYIRWGILFRTRNYSIFRLLVHLKPEHIQNSGHSILRIFKIQFTQKHASPWHIYDLCIFKPKHIESPRNTQKSVKHVWRTVFCRTLCNTCIFRTRGIFRTLSNIYDGKFYSQPCVTLAYLEP